MTRRIWNVYSLGRYGVCGHDTSLVFLDKMPVECIKKSDFFLKELIYLQLDIGQNTHTLDIQFWLLPHIQRGLTQKPFFRWGVWPKYVCTWSQEACDEINVRSHVGPDIPPPRALGLDIAGGQVAASSLPTTRWSRTFCVWVALQYQTKTRDTLTITTRYIWTPMSRLRNFFSRRRK